MPPVEERAELAGGWPSWSLGSAGYKPGHASRQLLVEEGMLLFSQGAEPEEGEPKPFKSLISNIDYFVGKFRKIFFLFQGFGSVPFHLIRIRVQHCGLNTDPDLDPGF
jgi:hypothetical protein